ncbi:MAG TPA: hypothetical protein GX739_05580 [Firmicutes bacterium]|nr:hypothetical protein [Bacillota bacterium]
MASSIQAGSKVWFIPDCYWPEITNGKHYVSHEAICVLNPGPCDATIKLTFYFSDAEPVRGFTAECKAERTNHIRLDQIKNDAGQSIPQGVPYAAMVESDQPIIVQYSRLDTTQPEIGLMTTMAYPL